MSIPDSWFPLIDQIISTTVHKHQRIIGLTSPGDASDVGKLSNALAESFQLSQINTLLIDIEVSDDEDDAKAGESWTPLATDHASFIKASKDGYDRLTSRPDRKSRFSFNNTDQLRGILAGPLSDYGVIILDLPPILSCAPNGVNPAACAAACDAVYLVCLTGQETQASLSRTRTLLEKVDAPLSGIILDDRDYVSTGESIANEINRLRGFLPFAERIAARVKKMELFN